MLISLDGTWTLRYCPETDDMPPVKEWESIPAQVPGNVELDLFAAGKEKDPFYGENIYDYRKYEYYRWHFSREFVIDGIPARGRLMLVFEGLNTYADVFVNDIKVGHAENMLVSHSFDITSAAVKGANTVSVLIYSGANIARNTVLPVMCVANDDSDDFIRQRKPPHSFGWDIMPRFPSAGMWRSVYVEHENPDRILQTYFVTKSASEKKAEMLFRYRVACSSPFMDDVKLRLRFGGNVFEKKLFSVSGQISFTVDDPELWWPRGYGGQPLYECETELIVDGKTEDVRRERVGIRYIKIDHVMKPGDKGEFLVNVNGWKVLLKGSNWVPLDAFHSRDAARYERALALFKEAGCNVLRCWGGNVYEDHRFYELCDEYGILIWQDFTLACALYPQDDEFLKTIESEAEQVIIKLRNHPSIMLWAGDNEVDAAYWGAGHAGGSNDYNAVTREALPRAVRQHDPYRYYIPSSPYIANGIGHYEVPEQHNWGPRAYFKDDFYRNTSAHFISECGYHGCPSPESLKKFIPEDKLWPMPNSAWDTHDTDYLLKGQRGYNRNILMADQVRIMFGKVPDTLDEFALLSQCVQAEAKKFFIERTRIKKWRRTGIIWWNMLDGWPQISDAVVDWYFTKKRAFDYIRRVQEEVCVMVDELSGWEYGVILGNDSREAHDVEYELYDGETGETLLKGKEHSPANENVRLGGLRIPAGDRRLIIIKWTIDGKEHFNHYITGYPAYDPKRMEKWLGIIDDMEKRQ